MSIENVTENEIQEIISDCKKLKPAIDQFDKKIAKVQVFHEQLRKQLKDLLQTCRERGWDPDQLPKEIAKQFEILKIKKDNCLDDLKTANELADKVLKELE